MKGFLIWALALLLCSASARGVKVETPHAVGCAIPITGWLYLTADHTFQLKGDGTWHTAMIDGKPALLVRRGCGDVDESNPWDNQGDWRFMRSNRCGEYPELELAAAEVAHVYSYSYKGKEHPVYVDTLHDGIARFDGFVPDGASGSPVIDSDGRLVGMITSGRQECTGDSCRQRGYFLTMTGELATAIAEARSAD